MAVAVLSGHNCEIGPASDVASAGIGFDAITWHRGTRPRGGPRVEALGRATLHCLDLEWAKQGPEAIEELADELAASTGLATTPGTARTTPVL